MPAWLLVNNRPGDKYGNVTSIYEAGKSPGASIEANAGNKWAFIYCPNGNPNQLDKWIAHHVVGDDVVGPRAIFINLDAVKADQKQNENVLVWTGDANDPQTYRANTNKLDGFEQGS